MAENSDEILHDFSPMLKHYKNGRIERFLGIEIVPPSLDPKTGVQSKDVEISPENNVSARLYLPQNSNRSQKLPLLVYYHGGAFAVESAFSPLYQKHLNTLVAEANVVAVSVNYRLAPEHPLPTAFEDSWLALQWIASESTDEWIKDYADLNRVFFGGDSAGANIAHNMAVRISTQKLDGINLSALFLNCPFFWGQDPIGREGTDAFIHWKSFADKLLHYVCPSISGCDEPWINPAKDEKLSSLVCKKVLVYVAEKDVLKDRGCYYKETLSNCGWDGDAELVVVEGEDHVFSVFNPESENGSAMLKKVASFINHSSPMAADSSPTEVLHDFFPLMRQYKDGRIERLMGTEIVPSSVDPETGVQSKDVVIAPENDLSARLYLPKTATPGRKLPLLVYFHGGGFVVHSAFSELYHKHLNHLVAEANVVAVSVNYRIAPEHPLPAAYDDSWIALRWSVSRSTEEEWIKEYADLNRVFLGGDSAGGNIVHNIAVRLGDEKLDGVNLIGAFLNCPFFCGKEAIGNEETHELFPKDYLDRLWHYICPSSADGCDDPRINPGTDPKLSSLGCKKLLVYVAEKDILKYRGWYYKELLNKSGWDGEIEVVEVEGEEHCFSVLYPTGEKGIEMIKRVASFLNQ